MIDTTKAGPTLVSGGADGCDFWWTEAALKEGRKAIVMSFDGHYERTLGSLMEDENLEVQELPQDILELAKPAVESAAKMLRKRSPTKTRAKMFIRRSYFVTYLSSALFAIGYKQNLLAGGTGWTIAMAINNQVDTYIFEPEDKSWYNWDSKKWGWSPCARPKLSKWVSGVGPRTHKIKPEHVDVIRNEIMEVMKGGV